MKGVARRIALPVFLLIAGALPCVTYAEVAQFVFTSDTQTVQPNTPSQQITLQAQASGGTSVNIPSTACIALSSTSGQGQFSSSATNWSPISVLTMSKNTANKNFYYQDAQTGVPIITVKAALKPDTVTSSCAAWPIEQWSVQWTATQQVTIGTGGTSETSNSSATSSSTTTSGTQTQTNSPTPVSSYVAPPSPTVFVDAGKDRTVIVGADTEFDGRAYNKSQEIIDHVRFLWNFGDGATAEGSAVLHHFSYPGRYAVILDIAQDKSAASDQLIVTAEPPRLSFRVLPDASVEIGNLAGRDLDLSGWLVRAGVESFQSLFALPPHSVILAGSSMHISRTTLGFLAGSQAELQYPNGVEVLQAGQSTGENAVSSLPTTPTPLSVVSTSRARSPKISNIDTGSSRTDVQNMDDVVSLESTTDATSSNEVAAAGTVGGWNWWWIAAIGLALVAAGALVAAQYFGKGEWDIIEEKPEAE